MKGRRGGLDCKRLNDSLPEPEAQVSPSTCQTRALGVLPGESGSKAGAAAGGAEQAGLCRPGAAHAAVSKGHCSWGHGGVLTLVPTRPDCC